MIAWPRLWLVSVIFLGGLLAPLAPAAALPERFTPPTALLDGYARQFKLDATLRFHIAIELEPRDPGLVQAATLVADPTSPEHRLRMTQAQFTARYGRSQADIDTLVAWLRQNGATNIYASSNRLLVGADFTVQTAEKAFQTKYDLWVHGRRSVVGPTTPLTLPIGGIRAVRGAIKSFTPRLADVIQRPGLPTDFRANWYPVDKFREAYDALPNGGAGMRIALIEDSSDRAEPGDVPGATVRIVTAENEEQACGRDDQGQEPAMDVAAARALAPAATIDLRYDEVCVRGGEGAAEIQHALDDQPAPDAIVFPFAVAPLYGPLADAFGPPPIPYLEAVLRGIPIVVPAGDDGAYGIRVLDLEQAAVTYPCVLPFVICAGGSTLGERNGVMDEAPWNDGTHATGGGISLEPRPSWQKTPTMEFALARSVTTRMVPDLSADAGGHLELRWHGYLTGGVDGTSESAAIVGAQLVAINAVVPPQRRLLGPGDLYVLASVHPETFRDITRPNDRGYPDNTLHPLPLPAPLGYHGVLPSPPPTVRGCVGIRPRGCDVDAGYDLVTGLGSLKEQTAAAALRASP